GVHHRGRGDQPDPADRHHHPVPVPGWLLAGSQLGADRPADADQRHRAAAGPAADPGRGHDPGGADRMNRALLRLSLACLAMFVLRLINVTYVQAFESSSLAGKPGNVRVFNQQFQYQRGSIIAAGSGQNYKIAESVPVKGTNTSRRVYPAGAMYAPITG